MQPNSDLSIQGSFDFKMFLKLWAKLCGDDLISGQNQEAYLLLVCINPWTLSSVVGSY